MAKRFTDTLKYKKSFIRSLPGAYKLFWDFLYHDCDHAGIWIVDFQIAQMYLGQDMAINKKEALDLFNSDEVRIKEIEGGKKWFIPSFIEFQYGSLSEKNRAHVSVISILNKYNLLNTEFQIKPLTSPLQGAKDKDKDKDKEQDKDKGENQVFWTDVKRDLLNAEGWHYQFCTEKNISQPLFLKTLNEFLSDQELKEDYKNLKETKNHFINWFNKNHKNGSIKTTRAAQQESSISKLIRIGEKQYADASREANTGT